MPFARSSFRRGFLSALVLLAAVLARAEPVRLMAVGDSITAGADFFSNYRYPLWEKLFAAGYVVEFVGTQTSPARIGPLAHEGYGGKNTEFLAATVPEHFCCTAGTITSSRSNRWPASSRRRSN
jgi:hypothetical protein